MPPTGIVQPVLGGAWGLVRLEGDGRAVDEVVARVVVLEAEGVLLRDVDGGDGHLHGAEGGGELGLEGDGQGGGCEGLVAVVDEGRGDEHRAPPLDGVGEDRGDHLDAVDDAVALGGLLQNLYGEGVLEPFGLAVLGDQDGFANGDQGEARAGPVFARRD
mmetsp:Transcript_12917/g.27601  ORF Transcript_12917/g.27601 Transcript_12917/m.27601 type:complete len:160 (-) Transcript_12917:483-962(-)